MKKSFYGTLILAFLAAQALQAARLVTYRHRGESRLGAVFENGIIDLNRAYTLLLSEKGKPRAEARARALVPPNMLEFLQGEDDARQAAGEALEWVSKIASSSEGRERLSREGVFLEDGEIQLLAPLPHPPHLLAIGLNYRKHAEETGQAVPEYPTVFTKEGKVIGPGDTILIPPSVKQTDYEVELAFVIGKRARNVPLERALEYVAGYATFNDVSARDIQRRTSQWTLGKSVDTFSIMGPYLVLRDEIPDPQTLRLTTRVGDEMLQDSHTSDMIFSVAEILAYISQVMELEPGTVVTTGTPSGVGSARKPQRWLRPGETVVVEVEKLGKLANPIRGQTPKR